VLHPDSPGHLIPVKPSIIACFCSKTVFDPEWNEGLGQKRLEKE